MGVHLSFGMTWLPLRNVQVIGNNQAANYAYATELLKRIRTVPGIADPRIQQVFNYPQINVEVDRTLAGVVGLTQRDVANSLRSHFGSRKKSSKFAATFIPSTR